jgi:hypothetical protein
MIENRQLVPRVVVLRWRSLEALGGRHHRSHAYVIICLPLVDRDDLPVTNAYPLGAAYSLIAVSRASRESYVPSGGSISSGNAVCAITATPENYGCG